MTAAAILISLGTLGFPLQQYDFTGVRGVNNSVFQLNPLWTHKQHSGVGRLIFTKSIQGRQGGDFLSVVVLQKQQWTVQEIQPACFGGTTEVPLYWAHAPYNQWCDGEG